MKIRDMATYHCHTTFSDGLNSVFEMVEHAQRVGFSGIGISDHLVLHPTEYVFWEMPVEKVDEYVKTVQKAKDSFDIPVYMGLEVDYFPNNPRAAEIEKIINAYPFDYLIGSIHFIEEFPIDYLPSDWEVLTQDEINQKYRKYWENIIKMVQTEMFDIVGHVDIIKKMNFLPSEDISPLIDDALGVIAEKKLTLEINTAGWEKPCAEMYPAIDILRKANHLNIPIMMNDDAHSVEQLGQNYKKSYDLLENSNLSLDLISQPTMR